jgi:hypothetical protein
VKPAEHLVQVRSRDRLRHKERAPDHEGESTETEIQPPVFPQGEATPDTISAHQERTDSEESRERIQDP